MSKATRHTSLVGEDEDDIDGCSVSFTEAPITADSDLPEAIGGVSGDTDLDGCDVDFLSERQTPDEELPAATGGGD